MQRNETAANQSRYEQYILKLKNSICSASHCNLQVFANT